MRTICKKYAALLRVPVILHSQQCSCACVQILNECLWRKFHNFVGCDSARRSFIISHITVSYTLQDYLGLLPLRARLCVLTVQVNHSRQLTWLDYSRLQSQVEEPKFTRLFVQTC